MSGGKQYNENEPVGAARQRRAAPITAAAPPHALPTTCPVLLLFCSADIFKEIDILIALKHANIVFMKGAPLGACLLCAHAGRAAGSLLAVVAMKCAPLGAGLLASMRFVFMHVHE